MSPTACLSWAIAITYAVYLATVALTGPRW